jgi:hypothetical protein
MLRVDFLGDSGARKAPEMGKIREICPIWRMQKSATSP